MTRGTKIVGGILAGLVVAAIAAKWTISGVYYYKIKAEVKLLEAEGGSTDMAYLSPKAVAAREGRKITLYKVEDFKYTHPKGKASGSIALTDPNVPEQDRITGAVLEMDEWFGGASRANSQTRPLLAQPPAWNRDWEPLLAKHVEANRAVLDRAKAAAAADGEGAFDLPWGSFDAEYYPHVWALREVVLLMRTEALLKAHSGDVDGAVEDVRLMFRLRRLLDGDPACCGKIQGGTLFDKTAQDTLEAILREGQPQRDGIEALLKELSDHEERNRISRALLGDTALELQCIRAIRKDPLSFNKVFRVLGGGQATTGEMPAMMRFALRLGIKVVWLSQADEYNFLSDAREMRARARLPFPEILASRGRAKGSGAWYAVTHVMTDRLLPPMIGGVFGMEARADAQLSATRVALAMMLYRADTGAYPAAPGALAPKYLPRVPADPHTGKPLNVRANGDGFAIYAVSADGTDHGGEPPDTMLWKSDK
jgi:hypothetical protein